MMRAVRIDEFGGPEVLRVADVPEPVAGPDQLLLDITAAEVLFLDTQLRAGWGQDYFAVRPPFVPGGGVVGTVIVAGAEVDDGWVGRRVIASTSGPHEYRGGGYAERVAVGVNRLQPVPDGVDAVAALAALSDGVMGVSRVEQAGLRTGDTALITAAAGSIGTWLVPLLAAAGVRVVAAARGRAKLDLSLQRGAHELVDYTDEDWTRRVPAGIDAVFDGVGGQIGTAALGLVRRGGRFFSYGSAAGDFADDTTAAARGVEVIGIHEDFPEDAMWAASGRALQLLADGTITSVIGQALPLEQAAQVHAAIDERRVLGKSVLLTAR